MIIKRKKREPGKMSIEAPWYNGGRGV